MKISLTFVFVFLGVAVFSQNACDTYFPFKEGITMEFKTYNKRDKLEYTSWQSIDNLSGSGDAITAEISTKMTDAKGKNTIDGSFTVSCNDGTFKMDVSEMIPAESLAAFNNGSAEMEMSGDGFLLPSNPEVGSTLPDSENTITINTGVINMKMDIQFTDRKVEAKESITTPAGTFDCVKFSYTTNTKMSIVKAQYKTVNWYAEGVGTVRSETYDKKGNLDGYMVLTKFEE